MINVGDTVKVISATKFDGNYVTFYPIGTICKVVEKDIDGALGILPDGITKQLPYFYMENELEKGSLEWVKQ